MENFKLLHVQKALVIFQQELGINATISQALVFFTVAANDTGEGVSFQAIHEKTGLPYTTTARLISLLADYTQWAKGARGLLVTDFIPGERRYKRARLSNYGKLFVKEILSRI